MPQTTIRKSPIAQTAIQAPPAAAAPVCFIWPPAYYPWHIPPGIAYLAGYLKSHRIPVRVIDANVQALEHVLLQGPENRSDTLAAIAALRDRRTVLSWRSYQDAMVILARQAQSISAKGPERIRFERNTLRYYPAFDPRSRKGLLAAAHNIESNLFLRYFHENLLPTIRNLKPAVIGISATDLHQLLPATVLAAFLRQQLKDECPNIVFGGNVFARIHEVLAQPDDINGALFAIWGAVIVGEGEQSLLRFTEAVLEGGCCESMEGLIRPGSERPQHRTPINLNELTAPLCEGMTPLTPEISVPLNIYRGCYLAGSCGFCDINQGYDSIWSNNMPRLSNVDRRLRSIDRVVEDVRECVHKYGTRLFSFTDEWFRVTEMLELADRLASERLFVAWDAYARLEPKFADPAVAKRLARGGARFLQFGLESASRQLLKLVGKDTDPRTGAKIFRALSAAGIWCHVFVIVGLPGETLHDALLTAGFLLEHGDAIFTIKPTRFRLSRHSPFAVNGKPVGIEIEGDRAQILDLALNLPFRYVPVLYCTRCREKKTPSMGMECPTCRDRLVSRPSLSHRAVNAMYTAIELLAARHWAYPFTSLYPYHLRLLFSEDEARSVVKARYREVDRNLGLSEDEVRQIVRTLGRQLNWEATHVKWIRDVYDRAELSRPIEWSEFEDFSRAARHWASAVFSVADAPVEGLVVLQ